MQKKVWVVIDACPPDITSGWLDVKSKTGHQVSKHRRTLTADKSKFCHFKRFGSIDDLLSETMEIEERLLQWSRQCQRKLPLHCKLKNHPDDNSDSSIPWLESKVGRGMSKASLGNSKLDFALQRRRHVSEERDLRPAKETMSTDLLGGASKPPCWACHRMEDQGIFLYQPPFT